MGTWGGYNNTYLSKSYRFLEGKYTFDLAGKSVEEGQLPFYNIYTDQIMGIDYQDVIPVRN